MYRFMALIWNREAPSQEEAASLISLRLCAQSGQYGVALKLPGLLVLSAQSQSGCGNHLLKRNSGVILGSIFERRKDLLDDSPSDRAAFNDRCTDTIIVSRGRALIADYWGNYVAILADDHTRSVLILKDPAGSLPCFMTSWRGISIAFSCLQDCLDLGVFSFTINWKYVEARLASNGTDVSHSSLHEVSQIYRGECLEISTTGAPSGVRRLYWKPVSFSERANALENVDVAAQALRACVRSACHTLAGCHSNILIRLSGGLDSSIVAACLKDAALKPTITSYTHFNPNGRSDERRWARLSARNTGFPHVERVCDPANISLKSVLQMAASVEPSRAAHCAALGEIELDLATQQPYTAVFSGDGGDSGFGAEAVRHVVDDSFRLRGLSFSAIGLAAAVALRTDTLSWRILRGSLLRKLRGSTMTDFRDRFLNKQSLAVKPLQSKGLRAKTFPHPWFSEHENVPWHVIRRVGALICTPEFYDPMRKPDFFAPLDIAPLYSQPVVELSLRIPLYVHFDQGVERGLARKAFAGDVPIPILRRLWKDRSPGAFEAHAHGNRALLKEIVLGGYLAKSGLIDRVTIEAILQGDFSKGGYFIGELFALLDLELWIRHFRSHSVQRAAA
jgi:asparagine synthase (glutamine-hydrolysing)